MSAIEIHRPLLSIITINKNNAEGVSRTITSLEPIRHDKTVECIFVDGLSSDTSVDLASQFYPSSCLVSEPDSGIYQAMNKGLALASGDWVMWINSGDEWIPSCWPQLKAYLRQATCDVLCGSAEIIDHMSQSLLGIKYADHSDLPWYMVNHSSTVIRRQTALSYKGYNQSYRISADRELIVRMFLNRVDMEFTQLCITRFWLGGISDRLLLLRATENLRVDLELGLIGRPAYTYGMFRCYVFLLVIRPLVLVIRSSLQKIGILLPPLGSYAGALGELPRDAYAQKN